MIQALDQFIDELAAEITKQGHHECRAKRINVKRIKNIHIALTPTPCYT